MAVLLDKNTRLIVQGMGRMGQFHAKLSIEYGTQVVGVHVGLMDTDMTAGIDLPKASPQDVAAQIVRALQDGSREVLADDTSRQVKASLASAQAAYLA